MGRLANMFANRAAAGEGALMPFITAGYPSVDITCALIESLAHSGADALEIGIPFSDPIADGPVIAASMHEALMNGATPGHAFEAVANVRTAVDIPLIAMVSISIVRRLGGVSFVRRAAEAGFDGLIVPDGDLQDIADIAKEARDTNIAFTTLIAPGSSLARTQEIASLAHEFVYLLTRRGLTGERSDSPELADSVRSIREVSSLPIAAGFGISTSEHVVAALTEAEGAIVGSALVRAVGEAHAQGDDPCEAARGLITPLAEAAHGYQKT